MSKISLVVPLSVPPRPETTWYHHAILFINGALFTEKTFFVNDIFDRLTTAGVPVSSLENNICRLLKNGHATFELEGLDQDGIYAAFSETET